MATVPYKLSGHSRPGTSSPFFHPRCNLEARQCCKAALQQDTQADPDQKQAILRYHHLPPSTIALGGIIRCTTGQRSVCISVQRSNTGSTPVCMQLRQQMQQLCTCCGISR